LILLLKCILN